MLYSSQYFLIGIHEVEMNSRGWFQIYSPQLLNYSSPLKSSSLLQIVLFKELGPERLWRRGNVRPALRGEIHEIPIRPDRIDMISLQFSAPEMRNPSVLASEDVHYRHLHVIRRCLTFVVRLIGRLESGDQRNLRPSAFPGTRVDFSAGAFAMATNAACRVT